MSVPSVTAAPISCWCKLGTVRRTRCRWYLCALRCSKWNGLGSTVRLKYWLVVCEDTLADGSFRNVLYTLKLAGSRIPLVVCSLLAEMAEYLEAMELGAFDFIAHPFCRVELERIINRALHQYSLAETDRPSHEVTDMMV